MSSADGQVRRTRCPQYRWFPRQPHLHGFIWALWLTVGTLLTGCRFILPSNPSENSAVTSPSIAAPTLSPPLTSMPIPDNEAGEGTSPAEHVGQPTPINLPDTGWLEVRPGLERRLIKIIDVNGQQIESLYILRLQPERFHFRVEYHPGLPQTLDEWQLETGALIVLNGGFFTPEYLATGLTIVDWTVHGRSYQDFGGMLRFEKKGPKIQILRDQPFDELDPAAYAIQSFPILISAGRIADQIETNESTARRTVVAFDRTGRFLIILAPWGGLSLPGLATCLYEMDLALEVALNLDGGASTGLLMSQPKEGIPAFTALPAVITVHEASSTAP